MQSIIKRLHIALFIAGGLFFLEAYERFSEARIAVAVATQDVADRHLHQSTAFAIGGVAAILAGIVVRILVLRHLEKGQSRE